MAGGATGAWKRTGEVTVDPGEGVSVVDAAHAERTRESHKKRSIMELERTVVL